MELLLQTPVPVRDELSTPTDSVMVVRCSYCVADNEFVPMPAYKDGRSGTPCEANTRGLLQRAHVVAGEIRYVGKETDRNWEEGDEISVLDFATTEYGRSPRVTAGEEIKNKILEIGVNKCARESGFDRKNFIRKLVRGVPVKRNS